MTELKRCPFCGCKVKFYDDDGFISCLDSDGGCGFYYTTPDGLDQKTIDAWNRRATGWIAVEDGLPEERKHVLVRDEENHNSFVAALDQGKWYFRPSATEVWFDVNYWQPLPSPPEEKK